MPTRRDSKCDGTMRGASMVPRGPYLGSMAMPNGSYGETESKEQEWGRRWWLVRV